MFSLAILIAIYSYIIFGLGVTGLLYKPLIISITVLYVLLALIYQRREILKTIYRIKKAKVDIKHLKVNKKNYLTFLALILIVAQAFINLIGVLGPEISFDALWYHLTLPKIYLLEHSIQFIPGGLMHYSAMPKLVEMLYVLGLSIGTEIIPKIIHYLFGLLTLIVIYKISRIYLNKTFSLLAALVFYSNLVVGWEIITAYIDLGRVFFEITALWAMLKWIDSKENKWLYESAVILGIAVSTKLITLISLPIFLIFIAIIGFNKKELFKTLKSLAIFSLITVLIPLPWFIFSFINTGSFVYPYFTKVSISIIQNIVVVMNPTNVLSSFKSLFLYSNDPISPIYLICLPLAIFLIKNFKFKEKLLFMYFLIGFLFWYVIDSLGTVIPEIKGGSRFMLSYLSIYSIFISILIHKLNNKKIKKMLIAFIILISLISIAYRGIANSKFVPVVLGYQSKSDFLTQNLNFNFGDFYDTDSYFKKNITAGDNVLLYGFHNLYYVDFPFIDSSWVKKGDSYNYIATQNTVLPERFKNWKLVYENTTTGVKLYNLYNLEWHY